MATWLAALRRAPATVVASVLVLGAPITAVLSAVANGTVPAAPVLAGQVLIAMAVGAVAVLALHSAQRNQVQPVHA